MGDYPIEPAFATALTPGLLSPCPPFVFLSETLQVRACLAIAQSTAADPHHPAATLCMIVVLSRFTRQVLFSMAPLSGLSRKEPSTVDVIPQWRPPEFSDGREIPEKSGTLCDLKLRLYI